jgi:hypothetical protein
LGANESGAGIESMATNPLTDHAKVQQNNRKSVGSSQLFRKFKLHDLTVEFRGYDFLEL